jgi:HAD superfamily hydrolase (TIGR01509 family)
MARARTAELGVTAPWQVFVQLRLRIYEQMLADPEILRSNQWPYNVALLQKARASGCRLGLATMSRCAQTRRVLEILELNGAFDFVATRDDVEHGKPNPEIYLLVQRELGVQSKECLVIEDSPSGVRAALAAGMWCIAVTTPLTRERIHDSRLLDERWVVDDPAALMPTVRQMYEERKLD